MVDVTATQDTDAEPKTEQSKPLCAKTHAAWVNDLLGPTAAVLGHDWAAQLSIARDEQQIDFVRDRVAAVQKELSICQPVAPNFLTVGHLAEWTDRVKTLDANNDASVNAWERALVEIVKGDASLLNFLKTASEKDIRVIAYGADPSLKDIERLKDAGLLENTGSFDETGGFFANFLFFFFSLAYLVYSAAGFFVFESDVLRGLSALLSAGFVVVVAITAGPTVKSAFRRLSRQRDAKPRYKKTAKGMLIAELIRPRLPERDLSSGQ